MSLLRPSLLQMGTAVLAALAIGSCVVVSPLLAVGLLLSTLGVVTLITIGLDRSIFLLTAAAIGLATFNALRPVSSATVSDVLLVVAFLLIVARLAATGRATGVPGWLWLSAGLFALAAGLVAVFPPPPSQAALFFPGGVFSTFPAEATDATSSVGLLLRLELAMLLTPLVIAQAGHDWTRIRQLSEIWVVGASVASLVGIAAYVGVLPALSLLGGDPHAEVTRVKGLTTHPNVFGVTAAMALPVAAVLFASSREQRRRFYLVTLAILLAAIGLSGSRAAILGGVFGLCVVAVLDPASRVHLRRVAILAIAVIVVAGLATFGSVPAAERLVGGSEDVSTSNEEREAIYSRIWSEIENRPIVGHGFEYLRGSHNIYLQAMHSGGAIALIALLVLVFGVLRVGLGGRAATPDENPPLRHALLASALTWLAVDGMFLPAILDRYLYIPIGLLAAVWAVSRRVALPTEPVRRQHQPMVAGAASRWAERSALPLESSPQFGSSGPRRE